MPETIPKALLNTSNQEAERLGTNACKSSNTTEKAKSKLPNRRAELCLKKRLRKRIVSKQ